ncbi:MAG: CHASE2 domain-containing protein [Alphaproteobacteria bacterium]
MIARLARFAPYLLLAAAIGLRIQDPVPVEQARLLLFDAFQRAQPRSWVDVPVRIVDIDEESLARHGQWPWPRTLVADLVWRLGDAGAAAIAFDIVFAEPDRLSPSRAVAGWAAGEASDRLREAAASLPDNDAVLAAAFSHNRVVTGFVTTGETRAERLPRTPAAIASAGDDPRLFVPAWPGAILNLPELEAAASGNGSINFVPGRDGVIRTVPLLARTTAVDPDDPFGRTRLLPAFGLEALRVAQDAPTLRVRASGASGEASFGARTGIVDVTVGEWTVPTDAGGNVWLHYTGHRAERFIPAWKVLAGEVDPAAVAGAILLVGTSAAGLLDLRATPLDPATPGVEVHAEMIEQFVLGASLVRPDWATGAEIAVMALVGAALLWLLPRIGALACAAVGGGAAVTAFAASWLAFAGASWLVDPAYPVAVIVALYISGSLAGYLRTEAERRRIRTAFGQYLAPALVEDLARHPEHLRLGGETREMSILFCDVRGFTSIAESFKSDPQGLTALINRLLTPLTAAVHAHGGTIDKYIGDCVMAFWNAPLDDPEHPRDAAAAALDMLTAVERLNAERERETPGAAPLGIGVGINTGEVVVGNIGSDQRFDYSVLGDAVNLAARLEGQSKVYGVPVVLGDDTAQRVAAHFALLELDRLAVKGKREAAPVWGLLGDAAVRDSDDFRRLASAHARMLAAYRGRAWDAAAEAGREAAALPLAPAGLYDLWQRRIAALRADPPGADWDGTTVATEK